MGKLERVKFSSQRGGIRRILMLSFILGLVLSSAMLSAILVQSDGTEPRGICAFVEGAGGLLPLNPNRGGTFLYSCDPDWTLMAFYVLLPAVVLGAVFFVLGRVFLLVRHGR